MAAAIQQFGLEKVRAKIKEFRGKSEEVVDGARNKLKINIEGRYSIRLRNSAKGQGILSEDEKAQIEHFIIKYQQLPEASNIDLVESNGKFHIENLDFFKQIINSYRPIIWNQRDDVYYTKIFNYCSRKLALTDSTIGTTLTVLKNEEDITELYIEFLKNRRDAIKYILEKSEFNYIYNGVLQHSDKIFSERLKNEYYSGDLNYILVQHAFLLGPVKQLLKPFYICGGMLYPDLKLGHL